jgi:ABC-type hemin transport system ATPase subunit
MSFLETRDLTIAFGGHVAVNRVSCTFRPGELTAIVGVSGPVVLHKANCMLSGDSALSPVGFKTQAKVIIAPPNMVTTRGPYLSTSHRNTSSPHW